MFDKLKQLKELQDSLKDELVETENNGVRVVINGKMEVQKIILNESLSTDEQALAVKKAINDGFMKIQLLVAKKMRFF